MRRPLVLAAPLALLSLAGCPEGTGAFAPGGGAARLLAPADKPVPAGAATGFDPDPGEADAPQGLPPGHPQVTGRETSRELLAKVEAMKAALQGREKPLEILVALGDLYYENARYLDAVDDYRQALAVAEPGWRSLEGLPRAAREAPPSSAARKECERSRERGYAELSAAAEAHARRGELADAAFCWRAALAPAEEAQVRRGNALFLAGDPDQGMAEHEALLARDPRNVDALFYLGAVAYDSAGEDLARLQRARSAWTEFQRKAGRADPRQKVVAENLPKLEQQIRNGGKRPQAAPAPAAPQPGEVSEGAAESIANLDVSDPAFWKAADAQLAEGEGLIARGRTEEGKERIKGMLPVVMMKAKDSPYFKRVLADMGYAYVKLGNGEMGAQMLGMALQQDPGYAPARQALDAYRAGRPLPSFVPPGAAAAAAPAARAEDVPAVPRAEQARSLRAVAARGESAFGKGDYGTAAAAWKQVLDADPYLAGELGLRARIAEAEKRLAAAGGR